MYISASILTSSPINVHQRPEFNHTDDSTIAAGKCYSEELGERIFVFCGLLLHSQVPVISAKDHQIFSRETQSDRHRDVQLDQKYHVEISLVIDRQHYNDTVLSPSSYSITVAIGEVPCQQRNLVRCANP